MLTDILVPVLLAGVIALNVGLVKHTIKMGERVTYVEAKTDIVLDLAGLDLHKVNRAIKDHKEELEQNGRPSVGCINVKSLYKEGHNADNA